MNAYTAPAKTATPIPDADVSTFIGEAVVFRMDPPLDGHEYVVASAVVAWDSGPETFIFPCTKTGEVIDWGELYGSFKGDMDIDRAIEGAGYEIV